MKARQALSALLALAGCAGGSKSISGSPVPGIDAGATIDAARALWAARKPSCEAYHYDREVPGLGGRVGGVMTVQIVSDVPQWRWYVGADLTADNPTPVEWFEDMTTLGAHPGAPPASTVEQLWDDCVAVLTMKSAALSQPLAVNEDGVPMTCAAACTAEPVPSSKTTPACSVEIFLVGFACGTIAAPGRLADAGSSP